MSSPIHARGRTACRPLLTCALALMPTLLACGGGGSPGSASLALVELGTKPSTVVSRTLYTFANPLPEQASVTAGTAVGPFVFDPGDLPVLVAGGGTLDLGVLFTPQGEGPAAGSVSLVFTSAQRAEHRSYTIEAKAETVVWATLTPTLDFGSLTVGQSAEREAQVLNASSLSPVTFTGIQLPAGGFSVVGNPFPLTTGPGETAVLGIRYTPSASGTHDGTLRLGPNDLGGDVAVVVRARASTNVGGGGEVITDYGELDLDAGGRTEVLEVTVPADAISLYLEGVPSSSVLSSVVGLDSLLGPGGKVYENASSTGEYIWSSGYTAFSTVVPNTDRTDVQLVSGGGTYRFSLRRLQGFASRMDVRAIVERRAAGGAGTATLPLNVYLAAGITPTAATAASDVRLQSVLARMDAIFSQQGISLGDIDYYDVSDSSYDRVTSESEFSQLLQTTSQASEPRLNLFFVQTALGGGVVGVSAAVGGPKRNGTSVSGVMSVYEGFSPDTIGLIAAHELGHFLGLYHTAEQDGTNDFIDDTADCPGSGTSPPECPTPGGGLLMHWQAVGGTTITDAQGGVIRGHPLMEPGSGSALVMKMKPHVASPESLREMEALGQDWCGTCRACKGILGN